MVRISAWWTAGVVTALGCGPTLVTPPGGGSAGLEVAAGALVAGDLVITEFYAKPRDCGADSTSGEYIEVYNPTGNRIRVEGLVLSDGIESTTLNDPDAVIEPNGFVVLRRTSAVECFAVAPGVPVVDYGVVVLADSGSGELSISGINGPIDSILYSGDEVVEGVARELSGPSFSASTNDNQLAWCDSQMPLTLDGITFGSPGSENIACPGPPVDTDPPLVDLGGVTPGSLVVSEVMVAPGGSCLSNVDQYIEIYNAGNEVIDLTGLTLSGTEPGLSPRVVTVSFDPGAKEVQFLRPGAYAVGMRDAGKAGINDCYNGALLPTFKWSDDNKAGALILTEDTLLRVGFYDKDDRFQAMDEVNFADVDPPDALTAWNLSENRLKVGPDGNDDPESWCSSELPILPTLHSPKVPSNEVPQLGTPGRVNTICPGLETDVPDDTDPPPAIPTADTLVEGDLVITEVMHDPNYDTGGWAQAQSEYFEIYNTLDHQVDLQGLIITVDGSTDVLTQNYIIEANSYALARHQVGCQGQGYPLNVAPCDFPWISQLNNGGSTLSISNASGLIDAVYLGGLAQDGYALELHGPILNGPDPHLANDDPAEWCSADSADMIGFSNDRGTPVLDNGLCYGSAPGGDTGDTGGSTSPVDTAPQPPPPPPVLGVLDLDPGDLVLTEVMFDPSYALSGGAQAASEYIEVYNLSGFEVDLTGLELGINGGTIDLDGSYTVDAGELAVFRRQAGCNGNGYALSVAPCHLEWAGINPSPVLSNNGSFVSIEAGGTVIDSIDLTGLGADGVSVQLALSSMIGLNPSGANDDPGNWCETPAGLFIGTSTDVGTPFAGNVPCTTVAPVDTGDTDVMPTDTAPPQWGIDDLSPGDLLISEVMFDPVYTMSGSAQPASEYIEIYNATANAINLTGLELGLNGGTTPFDTTFVVGPGEMALARRVSGCNGNGYDLSLAPCDLEWGSYLPTNPVVDLSNNGGALTLQVGTLVIDSIDLTGLVNDGISLQLTVESLTGATPAVANDDAGNWCETPAWQVIGTTGDRGTPSMDNVSCSAKAPIDTAVFETGTP